MTDTSLTEETTAQSMDWFGRVVSVLAFLVCAFGVYVLGDYILSRPAAQVLVVESQLSKPEQRFIASQLNDKVEGNFFTADIQQLQSQVADIGWVEAVRISRQWPNGLIVQAVPRHPVARFGSTRFLSQDGTIFEPLDDDLVLVNQANLPMMYGPDYKTAEMMQQYRQVNDWFKTSDMRVTEVSLTDRMTWFFKFNTGMRVIVDRENAHAKLYRLSTLSQAQLKPVWNKIAAVDLRYRNGMSVLWKGNKKPTEFNQTRINQL